MGDLTAAVTPSGASNNNTTPSSNPRPLPIREDCWSEEATSTLVDAWGQRYLVLNRGNLRQKDWQDVADAVNSVHGHTKKTHRTDVQCKNRIDTIKKKYKVEKARVVSSDGTLTSSWPFLERMDALIGSSFPPKKPTPPPHPQQNASPSLSPSPPVALPLTSYRRTSGASPGPGAGMAMGTLQHKRPAPGEDGGFFRRNFSAMAAAAAAETDSEQEEEDEEIDDEEEGIRVERGGREGIGGTGDGGEGMRRLARAIERFGEVYEKMEREKLRQMVDLEKQRMKFAKDLEMERMRIFTETQIQLEKIKKGGGGGGKLQPQQQQHHQRSTGSNGERDY